MPEDGTVPYVASMTYHNLRAFPPERGASVMRETVKAPRMEEIAGDLLGPLGWHGVAELDFRWAGTPDTEPFLIEVNPRFWGGLIQAVEKQEAVGQACKIIVCGQEL